MTKSSKPKEKTTNDNAINVEGDVANSVLIAGDKNRVTIQMKQLQTASTLFTIPLPVKDFTGREEQIEKLKAEFSRGAVITGEVRGQIH